MSYAVLASTAWENVFREHKNSVTPSSEHAFVGEELGLTLTTRWPKSAPRRSNSAAAAAVATDRGCTRAAKDAQSLSGWHHPDPEAARVGKGSFCLQGDLSRRFCGHQASSVSGWLYLFPGTSYHAPVSLLEETTVRWVFLLTSIRWLLSVGYGESENLSGCHCSYESADATVIGQRIGVVSHTATVASG